MGTESRKVLRLLRTATEKEVVALVLDTHADLATDTPVDTGWAAANWIISMATFSNNPSGNRPTDFEKADDTESLAGMAGVLGWTLKKGIIYITNNVPYISKLNDGHSKQAPPGFVDKIIQRRVTEYNNKVVK